MRIGLVWACLVSMALPVTAENALAEQSSPQGVRTGQEGNQSQRFKNTQGEEWTHR